VTRLSSSGSRPASYGCRVAGTSTSYELSLDQAANATTIAAVGKRMGMPDHAVTVAFAAALQESRLHNLSGGDLDSLGIFQQRPSQGWGTPEQVMTPRYAATAFFEHLARVPDWASLPVTVAAQRVQRSAAPDAYGEWEAEARVLAQALTGEIATGLRCSLPPSGPTVTAAALRRTVDAELGAPALDVPLATARGWTVASWLVGHAAQFGLSRVAFAGRAWTSSNGQWQPDGPFDTNIRVTPSPPR